MGAKINFRQPARDHPATDQGHEDKEIVADQPAATAAEGTEPFEFFKELRDLPPSRACGLSENPVRQH
jgi:hypothetical protein